jgi:hypothetical protein
MTEAELFELTTRHIGHCDDLEQLQYIIQYTQARIDALEGRVYAGRYYVSGKEVSPRTPHVWICRRLADLPGGELPEGAAAATCSQCGAPIAYNPLRGIRVPKVCMQCEGITPDPIPS